MEQQRTAPLSFQDLTVYRQSRGVSLYRAYI